MILIIASYAIFASTFTLGKAALNYAGPIIFLAFRMLISSIFLLGYQYFFNYKPWKVARRHIWLLVQLILCFYLAYVPQYWALQYVPSTKCALLYTFLPFAAAAFSYVHFAELLTGKKLLGLAIGLIGLIPALVGSAPAEESIKALLFVSWPEIAILISATAFAYGLVITRCLIKDEFYSAVMLNGIIMLAGGIAMLLSSPFIDTWNPLPVIQWFPFIKIVALTVIVNISYYTVNIILLKRYTATLLSFFSFLDPLFVALYGWIFLGETVSWIFFFSVFLVTFGLYLFYQEEFRQGYIR